MKAAQIILGSFLAFALVACADRPLVDVYIPIEGATWSYEDVKRVEVEVEDTMALRNIFVNIRHAGDYEWQNVYVRLKVVSPQGDSTSELISVALTDGKGRWLGSGVGGLHTLRHPYKEGVQFRQLGTYRFELEQYMRVNPLVGIHHVGLRIENP